MAYSYMDEAWHKRTPEFKDWLRRSAMTWRREPVVKRIDLPTKLVTARRLGYKAKPGIVMVRVRIRRGGARKPRPVSGRRQKAMGNIKFTRSLSLKTIAERRAARRYPNMTIRNSYDLYSDGVSHWYEVILYDQQRPGVTMQSPAYRRPKPVVTPKTIATLASHEGKEEPEEAEESS